MSYGSGPFRPEVAGLQWDTRPGFALDTIGGYALGAEVSFAALEPSMGDTPLAYTVDPSTMGNVPSGVVTDPPGSLNGPRIIGRDGFRTTSSADSIFATPSEAVPEGTVVMKGDSYSKEYRERYGMDKNGKMSAEGFKQYCQDQKDGVTPEQVHTTETSKNAAWAKGHRQHDERARAQEQVRGGTSRTPDGPVKENYDGTRRIFQRKKD